jgi:hypothetical protein
MQAYCRSFLKADLTVLRNGRSQVAMFTVTEHRLAVVSIAEALYRAEASLVGYHPMRLEQGLMVLRTIGYTDQGNELPAPASHWYLFVEGGQLLNGSLSHTDVPPTKLTCAQIKDAVEEGLKNYRKN